MIKVFFLHGNPGHPSDWDILIEHLPKNIEIHKVDTYSEKWVSDIQSSPEKVVVVAHSWGCYRFFEQVKKIEKKIERVFLINPYIVQEKPMGLIARIVLSIPVLGDKIIRSNHEKSYVEFVEKMISPQQIIDHPYYAKKLTLLSDVQNWKLAIEGKVHQQSNPANEASNVLGFAYFGSNDLSLTESIQKESLKNHQYIQIRQINLAGHAILWSHPEVITHDMNQTLQKIGYQAGSSVKNNVINFLEKHVVEHGDKIALKWANSEALKNWTGDHNEFIKHDQINFRDLENKIAQFAQGLLKIGIEKGDRVIIFLPMSVDMYIAMFAVQRIGAIAVFLDSWARSHHLGASAECVQPKAMISFDMAFKLVDQVAEFKSMPIRILYGATLNPTDIASDKSTHKYAEIFQIERSPIAAVESEFTGLITFTTGSTGKPKGANRTHRFLVAQHFALTHAIPYTQVDIDMPAFPIFSLNSLATGVTTVLPAINLAEPAATDSALLASQIINGQVSCTTLSPSMLIGLAKYCAEKNIVLLGLRRVVTGGAPISKDDVRAFYKIAPQTDIWILYGSTEAEPMAHIEGRDMLREEFKQDPDLVENGVNVGEISEDIGYKFIRVINGPISLEATSWNQLEVAKGEVGEFICTGDHVCRDYYNNPDAFKSAKILDTENQVWHRTGDLAYIDKNKNLWIVGRVNNAVERQGKYYFPVQAEVLLKRFPYTERCAFLGLSVSDQHTDQKTCAVIQLKESALKENFNFKSAQEKIIKIFDKNNIPLDYVKFVKSVPMDPRHHSKVEYAVLKKMLSDNNEVIHA